jgi:hypothetical protein
VQAPDPFIVKPIREAVPETTLADVVVGALGLTGLMVLVALVLGLVVAALMIGWHRRRPPEDDHLPSVSPFAGRSNAPPSLPDR